VSSVILLILGSVYCESILAGDSNQVIGWHWYNQPTILKRKQNKKYDRLYHQFQSLSASKQLRILQAATIELRDKAVLSGKVSDIKNYKRAQDMWVDKATNFTVGWERMLLANPSLNYALKYSHENALAPVMQQNQHMVENQAVSHLSKTQGLLLFYRADQRSDLMFVNVMRKFSKFHHIALILVSENKKPTENIKNDHFDYDHFKATALGINYFPALLLVNPKTESHQIVSYGYISQEEVSKRLWNITNNWRPDY